MPGAHSTHLANLADQVSAVADPAAATELLVESIAAQIETGIAAAISAGAPGTALENLTTYAEDLKGSKEALGAAVANDEPAPAPEAAPVTEQVSASAPVQAPASATQSGSHGSSRPSSGSGD